jgi:hypothetical protein
MFQPVKTCLCLVDAYAPYSPGSKKIVKRMSRPGAEVDDIFAALDLPTAVVPEVESIEVFVL